MSDSDLREIERRLLSEGNVDLVKWVRGILLAAQTQNVTVHETPLEQDAPLWERATVQPLHKRDIHVSVPRDYDFMFMGISVLVPVALSVVEFLTFCASARASIFVYSMNQQFDFPMTLLAARRQEPIEHPSRPCLRMPPRFLPRGDTLALSISDSVLSRDVELTVVFHGQRVSTHRIAHMPRILGGGCDDECRANPPHHRPRAGGDCAHGCEAEAPHFMTTTAWLKE